MVIDPSVFQRQLAQWRALERAAAEAEEKLKSVGHLASSPEVAALARDAAAKRRAADDYLSEILGPASSRPPASNDAQMEGGRKSQ